jgi:hypothetical protein
MKAGLTGAGSGVSCAARAVGCGDRRSVAADPANATAAATLMNTARVQCGRARIIP